MDAATIAANLAMYGLGTVPWVPCRGKGNDRRELGGGKPRPLVRVEELSTFLDNFPNGKGVVEGALDGSSIRVQNQEPVRVAVEKDRNVDDLAVITVQVQKMLGIKAPAKLSDDALLAEAKRRGLI